MGWEKTMIDLNSIVRKTEKYPVIELDGEKALLNTNTGKYIVLNEVGSELWDMLDDTNSVELLIKRLCEEYEVDIDLCKLDTLNYLNKLEDAELVIV